jgi:polyisoprenoid-binding protein YceI
MRYRHAFAAFLLAAAAALPSFAAPVTGHYVVDASKSAVRFRIKNFGMMTVKGGFGSFSGTVDLAEPFEKSVVQGSVKIGSVSTGIGKRDHHLRSADFFDEAKFPEMTFQSARVTGTPDAFDLEGTLTIKGIPISVRFKGRKSAVRADGALAVTAEAVVDRRDFGLGYGATVGNDVTIVLDVVAAKAP